MADRCLLAMIANAPYGNTKIDHCGYIHVCNAIWWLVMNKLKKVLQQPKHPNLECKSTPILHYVKHAQIKKRK